MLGRLAGIPPVLGEAARKFAGVRDIKEGSDYQPAFGFRAAEYTHPLRVAPDRPPTPRAGRRARTQPIAARLEKRQQLQTRLEVAVTVTSLIVVEIEDRS
jgi:hypothetical protein